MSNESTTSWKDDTLVIRLALAAILFMHSVPGMFTGGVNDFGRLYLNEVGFAPFGLPLAWAIKLSHLVCAVLLILNRKVLIAGLVTIPILIAGIFMVHLENGWYVVGGGSNGIEFNLLLIASLLFLIIYQRKKR